MNKKTPNEPNGLTAWLHKRTIAKGVQPHGVFKADHFLHPYRNWKSLDARTRNFWGSVGFGLIGATAFWSGANQYVSTHSDAQACIEKTPGIIYTIDTCSNVERQNSNGINIALGGIAEILTVGALGTARNQSIRAREINPQTRSPLR